MKYTGLSYGGISPVFRGDVVVPIAELGDAPLVAVVGENGTGKTTMLELLPGSWSRWTPSRGAVASLANRRDSYVQATIELCGHEYITKQLIDGIARKTKVEAYLTRDGVQLSAGGARDFEAQISKYFPSRDLYFASGFAAQGGEGMFLELPPAKRKALFADLLGCGNLQLLSEAAGERARSAEKTVTGQRGQESQLEEQAGRLGAAQDELTAAGADHTHAAGELEQVEAAAAMARQRLEEWHSRRAELSEAASAARSALERARRELVDRQRQEDRVADELATVSAKRARLEDQLSRRADLEAAVSRVGQDETDLAAAKDELAELRRLQDTQRAAVDEWRERRDLAAWKLSEAETDLRTVREKIDSDHRAEVAAWQARGRDAEGKLRDAETALERARDRIAQEHRDDVSSWRQQRESAERYLRDAEWAKKNLTETGESNINAARKDLDLSERLAAGLKDMPCGGSGKYSECELLTGAVRARGDLASLREHLAACTKRLEDDSSPSSPLSVAIDEARADLEAIPTEEPAAPDSVPPEAAAVTDAVAEANAIAQEGPPAPTATIPPEAASVNEELNALAAVDRAEPAAHDAKAIPAVEELVDRITVRVTAGAEARAKLEQLELVTEQAEELDAEAAGLRDAIADGLNGVHAARIDSNDAGQALTAAGAAVDTHDIDKPDAVAADEITRLRATVALARDRQTTAKAAVASAEAAANDIASLRIEIKEALTDLDDWKHLQKVLGRDGVQALLIDAAAPEVSELINMLLHACYGSRFSCELKTSVLKADGKSTKEDFDLHVIDTVDGTEGSASLKSGGQKVLISEALSLAIAIYNARMSSIPIEDLVRDECAGALSSANAVRYIEMLRKALDLGDFHRCYFVAHQPHLWDLADARLLVANGDVTIAGAGEIEISSATLGEDAA